MQGYDPTKQKSPGNSRAISRICRSSMITLDKHGSPLSLGASYGIFHNATASDNFIKRTPLSLPSFSGWKVSYFSKCRPFRWERLKTNAAYDVASAVEVINDLGLDTLTFLAVTVLIMPTFKLIKASPVRSSWCFTAFSFLTLW